MAKRLFLQKAHRHATKHPIVGQLMSEKYDGIRCFWDGGISRGLPTATVPWANTNKDKREFIATGLWSMNAKAIFAPDWFLNKLPNFPLDGELWAGRGKHQQAKSAVSTHVPIDSRWEAIKYMIFDSPNLGDIFKDGTINTPTHFAEFNDIESWLMERGISWEHKWQALQGNYSFDNTLTWLAEQYLINDTVMLAEQEYVKHKEQAYTKLRDVLASGGEGIVLRSPHACYDASRVHSVTKWKPYIDDEAEVVGYKTGRETALGSKLLGLMGAMEVEWRGKRFYLSGFTDEERRLTSTDLNIFTERGALEAAEEWAIYSPDCVVPNDIEAVHFPRGSKVTFKYRELTDEGIPKEASYFRIKHIIEG